jgi:predicted nucleic acid-binding protein
LHVCLEVARVCGFRFRGGGHLEGWLGRLRVGRRICGDCRILPRDGFKRLLHGRLQGRLREGHAVQPACAAIGTEDAPVDATALQEQHLVTTIEDTDLRRTEFVRAIQQPDQPIPDLPPLVAVVRFETTGREEETGRFGDGPQRIGPANFL